MSDPMPTLPGTDVILKTGATYAKDLVDRVLSTFLEAFIAGIVVTQPLDISMWHAAAIGGIGAVASLIKGLLARLRDDKNSASLAKGV